MQTNKMKQRLKNNDLVLCMIVSLARTNDVPMMAAACGFHAMFVDMEHSAFSIETASQLCTAAAGAGITPLVRPSSKHDGAIGTLLDCGAQGLMVPHISSAAEARELVARCKFPPLGSRSVTLNGPHVFYQSHTEAEIIAHMNEQIVLIALLETPAAIEQADEIAAVPGIDVVHVGSRDVAAEMGIPGDYKNPRMIELYKHTAKACARHGKAMGFGGARGDEAFQIELYRMGVRYMTIGSDVDYVLRGGRAEVSSLLQAVASA